MKQLLRVWLVNLLDPTSTGKYFTSQPTSWHSCIRSAYLHFFPAVGLGKFSSAGTVSSITTYLFFFWKIWWHTGISQLPLSQVGTLQDSCLHPKLSPSRDIFAFYIASLSAPPFHMAVVFFFLFCFFVLFRFVLLKVDIPILTCTFFTFNWLTLTPEMHFVKFHPKVVSCLLSRGKRKYAPLGDEAIMKIHKKLFSGIPINFTFFVISPKLKRTWSWNFGFTTRKIWAFIWYQKMYYFRLSPGRWECDQHKVL